MRESCEKACGFCDTAPKVVFIVSNYLMDISFVLNLVILIII